MSTLSLAVETKEESEFSLVDPQDFAMFQEPFVLPSSHERYPQFPINTLPATKEPIGLWASVLAQKQVPTVTNSFISSSEDEEPQPPVRSNATAAPRKQPPVRSNATAAPRKQVPTASYGLPLNINDGKPRPPVRSNATAAPTTGARLRSLMVRPLAPVNNVSLIAQRVSSYRNQLKELIEIDYLPALAALGVGEYVLDRSRDVNDVAAHQELNGVEYDGLIFEAVSEIRDGQEAVSCLRISWN